MWDIFVLLILSLLAIGIGKTFMPTNRDLRVTEKLRRAEDTINEDRRGAGDRLKIREMRHDLHKYGVIAILVLLFILFIFYFILIKK